MTIDAILNAFYGAKINIKYKFIKAKTIEFATDAISIDKDEVHNVLKGFSTYGMNIDKDGTLVVCLNANLIP